MNLMNRMKMKNLHIWIYLYIWIHVDIRMVDERSMKALMDIFERSMKACLSLLFAVVHSRLVFRYNKHNNMHVGIQTSVKRMMKACMPLSLADCHSEHVVHVCVCLSVWVCVSSPARRRDRDLAVPGPCLFRAHRLRGMAVESVVRKWGVCKSCFSFFFSILSSCMFLRVAKKKNMEHGASIDV